MSNIIIDESTNMPELPEGYIWRVTFTEADRYGFAPYGALTVTLRPKNRWRAFWDGVSSKTYNLHDTDESGRTIPVDIADYQRVVQDAAEVVMQSRAKWAAKEMHKEQQSAVVNGLVGNYPPKKLVING